MTQVLCGLLSCLLKDYNIYTIKTQLICIYVWVYIYMFICSELIEETGRPPGLIFGMWEYFWPGSDNFESRKIFDTFDGVMTCCHIFESVKNHINADISHPIKERNAKS